jgi:hypothetical protein
LGCVIPDDAVIPYDAAPWTRRPIRDAPKEDEPSEADQSNKRKEPGTKMVIDPVKQLPKHRQLNRWIDGTEQARYTR